MTQIKPGDRVICTLFPERGPCTVTFISFDKSRCFLIWGEFGKMLNREYEITSIEHLKLV